MANVNSTLQSLSTLPAKKLAPIIARAINAREDAIPVGQAVIVRLLNNQKSDMFGDQVVDTLPRSRRDRRHLGYNVSSYPFLAGGATGVILATDGKDDYVLLAQKSFDTNQWRLPEGYMNAISYPNKLGQYTIDTPAREPYEIEMLHDKEARPRLGKIQKLSATPPCHDATLEAALRREMMEETGLLIHSDDPMTLVSSDTYGPHTDSEGKHISQRQVNAYAVDLRGRGSLPAVKPASDLKNVKWAKLSDIEVRDGKYTYQGAEIISCYAAYLEKSLALMREKELASFGVTEMAIKGVHLNHKPESELGASATAWHEEALRIAKIMQNRLKNPISAEELRGWNL